MSAILAGLALGGSAVSNRRGRKAQDKADDSMQQGVNALTDSQKYIDDWSGMVDNFAKLGQDSYNKYSEKVGGLEKVMGDYYENLNPDQYASQGNQTAQAQYQQSMNQVNDQLAAQGIQSSGISAQQGLEQGNVMAQTKAQNIMNAPAQVAQQQQQWLNYNAGRQDQAQNFMGQGVTAQGNVANMYQSNANNIAKMYSGNSAQNQQQSQFEQGQSNKLLGTGLYMGDQANLFGGAATKEKPGYLENVNWF